MITSVLQYMCVQKLCPNSYERQKLKFTFSHWITIARRLYQWYGEYLISLNKIAWNLLFVPPDIREAWSIILLITFSVLSWKQCCPYCWFVFVQRKSLMVAHQTGREKELGPDTKFKLQEQDKGEGEVGK